jgi:carbamoyl-phosphate synthase large subunit
MGGQTALNTALSLRRMGVLERYGVEMIGANAEAIDKAEDRALFREAMAKIGLETPRSMLANATDLKDEAGRKHEAARADRAPRLVEPTNSTPRSTSWNRVEWARATASSATWRMPWRARR